MVTFGAIALLFKAKNLIGLFRSKWTWIILAGVLVIGYGWVQTSRAASWKESSQQFELNFNVAVAAKAKLLEDMQRMNDINNDLVASREAAYQRLEAFRNRTRIIVDNAVHATTPEAVATSQGDIDAIVNSLYECIESATGKQGVTCTD